MINYSFFFFCVILPCKSNEYSSACSVNVVFPRDILLDGEYRKLPDPCPLLLFPHLAIACYHDRCPLVEFFLPVEFIIAHGPIKEGDLLGLAHRGEGY